MDRAALPSVIIHDLGEGFKAAQAVAPTLLTADLDTLAWHHGLAPGRRGGAGGGRAHPRARC